ncbi:MAG: hypothetical protein NC191_10005 [Muribaculaceae bacterium]|nr:hypothetical protein [Muribaculaceae bacterium]
MFEELKEVFELATGATAFVNELLKIKNTKNKKKQTSDEDNSQLASSGDNSQLASSGYYSKVASSGDNSQLASSGDWSQVASSGDNSQLASSGDNSQLASSGHNSKLASSGYYSKVASSGDNSQLASSGDWSQLASSGDWSQVASSGYYSKVASSGHNSQLASSGHNSKLASSGYYSKVASSGDNSQLASSGDWSQVESTGNNCVIAAIGFNSVIKAKKGSWITLAEYKQDAEGRWVVSYVKSVQVDGEVIKEDVFYTLYNKDFREVEEIDDVQTIILKRRKNIIQGKFLNDKTNCFIFQKNNVSAHGKTVKQAYRDWLFKTSDRDVSKYENLQPNEVHELNFWIVAYRTITGACSFGTENYLENNKDKYKEKMTLKEVLEATKGQYGHNTFREFFEGKDNG